MKPGIKKEFDNIVKVYIIRKFGILLLNSSAFHKGV